MIILGSVNDQQIGAQSQSTLLNYKHKDEDAFQARDNVLLDIQTFSQLYLNHSRLSEIHQLVGVSISKTKYPFQSQKFLKTQIYWQAKNSFFQTQQSKKILIFQIYRIQQIGWLIVNTFCLKKNRKNFCNYFKNEFTILQQLIIKVWQQGYIKIFFINSPFPNNQRLFLQSSPNYNLKWKVPQCR
ncbi:unnamed protein product [Paramecium octaurelia]|uniref:Uncharacterized protein n=1 Tax=Paramecium octaurelia TaxID=43137 RepID=A0A8S1WCH3_PAROT|nr:unnamed protein product [Paramecium octaurelia]